MHDEDALDGEQGNESGSDPDATPEQDVQGYDDEPWDGTDEEPGWPDEPSSGRPGAAALAGTFLLGIVTCLVLVLIWGALTGEDAEVDAAAESSLLRDSRQPGTLSAEGTSPTTGDPSHDHPGRTRLVRCATSARTLQDSMDAAQPALEQWGVHVGAMNQLVVGEITLQQATAFWERTRLGAQRHIAAFRDAVATLRRQGVDCPSPALLAPGARALAGCAPHGEAQIAVVRAATTSIDTWDQHVKHMDMMRLGELSPAKATEMWLSMWRAGVRDLDAYDAAVRRSRQLDGCADVGEVG
jgi:hypothetical protein